MQFHESYFTDLKGAQTNEFKIIYIKQKVLFSFVLKQKKQKFKKRSSANTQAGKAPATFSGQRAAMNLVLAIINYKV